jgi:hypothetical protein
MTGFEVAGEGPRAKMVGLKLVATLTGWAEVMAMQQVVESSVQQQRRREQQATRTLLVDWVLGSVLLVGWVLPVSWTMLV